MVDNKIIGSLKSKLESVDSSITQVVAAHTSYVAMKSILEEAIKDASAIANFVAPDSTAAKLIEEAVKIEAIIDGEI